MSARPSAYDFEERELEIAQTVLERELDLREDGEPFGYVHACQGFPRCTARSGEDCPWCTVILVHADGTTHRREPGRA